MWWNLKVHKEKKKMLYIFAKKVSCALSSSIEKRGLCYIICVKDGGKCLENVFKESTVLLREHMRILPVMLHQIKSDDMLIHEMQQTKYISTRMKISYLILTSWSDYKQKAFCASSRELTSTIEGINISSEKRKTLNMKQKKKDRKSVV